MKFFLQRFFISLTLACLKITLACLIIIKQGYSQTITTLAPSSGIPGQKTDVVIRGMNTHFKSGISKVSLTGSSDIEVKNLIVQDELTAIVTFEISPGASPGFRTLIVTTNNESARIENGFEVFLSNSILRVTIQPLPVQSIQLSDFDVNNAEASPVLFFSNVYNDNIRRRVKIFVLFSGASAGFIGSVQTDEKQLDPSQYYKLTNKDFGHFTANGNNGNAIIKEIREKGSLPPDEYTYKIEIRDLNGNVLAGDEEINIITNPNSNPELITPGSYFSEDIDQMYSPQPLFQWFGNNTAYDFALYFYTDGQTQEETVRGLPVFRQEDIKGTNFLYPNYAEKLIEGRVYAWQIKGKFAGSKGTRFLPSQVFRFTYSSAASGSAVSKINITPVEIDLKPGEKIQFKAELLDKENRLVTSIQPVWQVTPSKGTITNNGLFTAGNEAASVAVLVKAGAASDFATVSIKPAALMQNAEEWMIENLIRKVFGLPAKSQ